MKKYLQFLIISLISVHFLSCGKKQYVVEKSIDINAPIDEIFIQLNSHHNRKNWSPWEKKDTNQIVEFSGVKSGAGASYSWKGNDEVGAGSMLILESKPSTYIKNELTFTDPWESTSIVEWNLKENNGNVNAIWSIKGEVPLLMSYFMDMNKEIGPDLEQGLINLKKYCEENTSKFKMLEVVVDSQAYLTIRETISVEEKGGVYGRIFGEIANYIVQNGGTPTPKPIAIFYTNSETNIDLELGIAVDKEYKETNRIKYKKMNTRNALSVSHFGKYDDLANTYSSIMKFIEVNKIVTNGAPWEEYITDPSLEPDTNKWETKIYFPIP